MNVHECPCVLAEKPVPPCGPTCFHFAAWNKARAVACVHCGETSKKAIAKAISANEIRCWNCNGKGSVKPRGGVRSQCQACGGKGSRPSLRGTKKHKSSRPTAKVIELLLEIREELKRLTEAVDALSKSKE